MKINKNLKIYSAAMLCALLVGNANTSTNAIGGNIKVASFMNVAEASGNERYIKLNDTSSSLNFRKEPTTNSKTSKGQSNIICKLKHGDVVKVNVGVDTKSTNGVNWINITFNNNSGWIDSSKLSISSSIEDIGKIVTTETYKKVSVSKDDTLNVRKAPTTKTQNIIGKLRNGEVVEILKETNDWYLIRTKNVAGWASKAYLKNTTDKITTATWNHKDAESEISIKRQRKYGSDVYIANIKIKDRLQFKHVYDGGNSLNNKLNTVKSMSDKYSALFAVNASGFNKDGSPWGTVGAAGKIDKFESGKTVVTMDYNGRLNVLAPKTQEELEKTKPFWVATFGPTLVRDYKNQLNVNQADERHPRMAIGQGENANEFTIISVDGRSALSQGTTRYELGEIFKEEGIKLAYNLDGGGSSTMVFKGTVINRPSDLQGPRKVVDTIFIRNIR